MFNSKKQPTSRMPWAIQVLTTEYLIDGTVQPGSYMSGNSNVFEHLAKDDSWLQQGGVSFTAMTWTGVHVQPTGNLGMPVQTYSVWQLMSYDNVVAFIPNDDASKEAFQDAFKNYKHPLSADVFSGPYRIRGAFLSQSANRLTPQLATENSLFPLQDARIESLLPGASLTGMQAQWLLLNAFLLHGVGVNQPSQG
jgi:hypothetical protein